MTPDRITEWLNEGLSSGNLEIGDAEKLCATEILRPEVVAFARLIDSRIRFEDSDCGPRSWAKDTPEEFLERTRKQYQEAAQCCRDHKHAMRWDDDFSSDLALNDMSEKMLSIAVVAFMAYDKINTLPTAWKPILPPEGGE